MSRTFLSLLLAGLVVLVGVGFGHGQNAPAHIVVNLPQDARLLVDGNPTKQTGASRTFVSPPLQAGIDYSYNLTVEVVRDGKTMSRTKSVPIRAGQTVNVDLSTVGTEDEAEPYDPGWPREYTDDEGNRWELHQPQVDEWRNGLIRFRMAVALTPKGQAEPAHGGLFFAGQTATDLDDRVVTLFNLKLTDAEFDAATPEQRQKLIDKVNAKLTGRRRDVALDRLLVSMPPADPLEDVRSVPATQRLPVIFVSQTPAVLLFLDGEPQWRPIPGTGLEHVLNTEADVLRDAKSKVIYFVTDKQWLKTTDLLKGPWENTTEVSADVAKIPDNHPRADVKSVKPDAAAATTKVFVSYEPAELLVFNGPPKMEAVPGTGLEVAANTENDVFRDPQKGLYYVLLAGRWARAKSLDGPWEAVKRGELPGGLAKIPADSPRARVLASVPGTQEAAEAVALAQVPRLATVKRSEAKLDVSYDGDPKWRPVQGTKLQAATNTPNDVIRASDGKYYCCYQGVWFVSDKPEGPWAVADSVPDEVYDIPPSDPLYPDTYVEVYDSSPEEVVTGYTAGYLGCYVCDDAVVYGTGYYYPPYLGAWYLGYPCTWGNGVWYNPWSGGFVYRNSFYTPYAHGYVRAGYNPISGWYGAGYPMNTPYSSWGRGVVGRGDQWLRGGYYAGPGGGGAAGIAGSGGGKAGAVVGPGGTVIKGGTGPGGRGAGSITKGGESTRVVRGNDNLYVGHDGNVYRRNDNGTWQKRENHQWTSPAAQAARQAVNRAGFNQPSLNRPAMQLRQDWQSRAPATRPGSPQLSGQRPMNTIPRYNTARPGNVPRPAPQVQRPNINLNNEYQMRQQGQRRVQNFQQARPQIQPARPQINRAPSGFNRGMRPAGGGGFRGGGRGGRR
jgi:uncharacterized protein (TIGR03000 family)